MHGDQAVRCKITGKQCEFKQSSDECSQFAVKNVLKLNIRWPSVAIAADKKEKDSKAGAKRRLLARKGCHISRAALD